MSAEDKTLINLENVIFVVGEIKMRRLELFLGYYSNLQISLLTGIFFLIYLFLFMEASLITIFLVAIGLYLFAGLMALFFVIIIVIAGVKMEKFKKEAQKFKGKLMELSI